MRTLTIAFSPEGPTDVRFLGSVIRRTAEALLTAHGRGQTDVLEPIAFMRPKGELDGAERLLAVARLAFGFHCLVVHADADDTTPAAAWAQRLAPGQQLIAADAKAQQQVVRLVPVAMTEAWMLADAPALREALDTDLDAVRDLELPRPARAEQATHPKNALKTALQRIQDALPPRRRQPVPQLMADLYGQLAEVPLTSLRELESYRQFETDFRAALAEQGFVEV